MTSVRARELRACVRACPFLSPRLSVHLAALPIPAREARGPQARVAKGELHPHRDKGKIFFLISIEDVSGV